jgi:hypothetical protein
MFLWKWGLYYFKVVIPTMMWWLHSLRLEVAAIQQQFHIFLALMWVHSHRQVHAPVAAQLRRNEQALSVERLGKFYPLGDISGSVPVYVTQSFHTVSRACLPCSQVSIVSRNRYKTAKPQWVLNGLRFSAAISAHWRWVVVSIFSLSYPMWCHVLGFGYIILYLCFLFFFTSRFLPRFLVRFCSLFYAWKNWSAPSCSLSWAVVGHCALFLEVMWLIVHSVSRPCYWVS